jgi:hypothetical protein
MSDPELFDVHQLVVSHDKAMLIINLVHITALMV